MIGIATVMTQFEVRGLINFLAPSAPMKVPNFSLISKLHISSLHVMLKQIALMKMGRPL